MHNERAFEYFKKESGLALLQDLEIGVKYEGLKRNELFNLLTKYATTITHETVSLNGNKVSFSTLFIFEQFINCPNPVCLLVSFKNNCLVIDAAFFIKPFQPFHYVIDKSIY